MDMESRKAKLFAAVVLAVCVLAFLTGGPIAGRHDRPAPHRAG
jgi:hypothetical protein